MILKIGICDDELLVIDTLKEYLKYYEFAHDIDFEIFSATDSKEFLEIYNSMPGTFHILFLDVEMPGINGIELATRVRNIPDRDVHVIFISSYPEYMKDSFNVQAFQYLTKPVSKKDFEIELNRIITDIVESVTAKLVIPTAMDDELVFLNEIIYIKSTNSKKKQVEYVLKNRRIESYGIISELEKQLQVSGFVSPAQGYLVHLQFLKRICKNDLIMSNGDIVPMSRRKEKTIREFFNEQLLLLAKKR